MKIHGEEVDDNPRAYFDAARRLDESGHHHLAHDVREIAHDMAAAEEVTRFVRALAIVGVGLMTAIAIGRWFFL